ncbi:MAG: type II toxin-antitoxin system PemK/MazF family toxin [Caldilineales bacterium]|nr:type II toxin-antitoxin system PemK/MazF family toxin [Caldilineales bacterium]MCW5859595.1 type II toxin-antitoxin system PemK/MazF family toxin [Caldilineales bacterium]
MMIYRQGDILLVPFPFTDQSGIKQRPAVVLSGVEYNREHPDIILAPLSSQIAARPDETAIADWRSAGLLKPSVVKPVLSSFDTSLVRKKLGTLAPNDLNTVRKLFSRIFELD